MPSSRTGPKKADKAVIISPSLDNCDTVITLDCLRALYNIDYKPVATSKNTYGIGTLSLPHEDVHGTDGCCQWNLPLNPS